MLLQCFNISSNFQPMRSTFLPCWTKTFQHVRLEPELLLWLPEFRPSSWVANSRKRPFSLSRTLLPHSSVEAPLGIPIKIAIIEKKRERESEKARGGRCNGCALSFPFWQAFPQHKEASVEERCLLPRETWENGWNSCRLWRQLLKNLPYPTDNSLSDG